MNDNFPRNSKHDTGRPKPEAPVKAEPKQITRVVSGETKRRKKPLGRRFSDTFFGGSSPRDIWAYVLLDVLVPAGRDMVADAGREALERAIYGDSHTPSRRNRSRKSRDDSPFGRVRYDKMSSSSRDRDRERDRGFSRRARMNHDFDEIILDSRHEATEVLSQMYELLDKYESVSVADLYTMVNVTPEYTDHKFGWTLLSDTGVTRVRDGYLLDLPRPEPLD